MWQWEPGSVFVELEPQERGVRDVVCRLQQAEGLPFEMLGVEAEVSWLEVLADGRQLRASPVIAQQDRSGDSQDAVQQAVVGDYVTGDDQGDRRTACEARYYKEIRLCVRADLVEDWTTTRLGTITDAPRQFMARLQLGVKRRLCGLTESAHR